jgi:CubicO group peptidase (beta-lactamase class C family)
MRILAFACFVLACQLAFTLPAFAREGHPDFRQLVDSYAKRRGFNGTVLVARGGRVLFRGSYGQANAEWAVPNGPNERYRIGSLSKPLVATLVMQLVEQGRLTLDGTLGAYLPDVYGGTAAAPVTVAQLLSHTSGLADLPARYDDAWYQTEAWRSYAPLDFAREWIKPTLLEQPGTKFRYNNNGFYLLGVIIERVTGQKLTDNLQQRLFGPAGMSASGLFAERDVLPKLALGYSRSSAGVLEHPLTINSSVSFSAAGIYSTADDLFRFDCALYGSQLLRAETRALMLQAHSAAYGFGWNVGQWTLPDGRRLPIVSHTGSVPGYQSYYLRSELNQDCVIILDNFWQGALVVQMGQDLMEVLNGKPMQLAARSLDDLLTPIAYREGTQAMLAAYQGLATQRHEYDLSENAFNALGYKFLRANRLDEAIAVFGWAVQLFPQSSNTHDSLGEAYRKAGKLTEAARSYAAALALDPTSTSAQKALEELKGSGSSE